MTRWWAPCCKVRQFREQLSCKATRGKIPVLSSTVLAAPGEEKGPTRGSEKKGNGNCPITHPPPGTWRTKGGKGRRKWEGTGKIVV